MVFTVILSAATTEGTVYAYSLAGTATAPDDYNATPTLSNGVIAAGGNFTVPTGVSSFTATFTIVDDATTEGAETILLTVGGVTGTGTINSSDPVVSSSAEGMLVGMNLSEPVYFVGPVPWANVVWSADRYQRLSDFLYHPDQRQGLISGAGTATDTCVAVIAHTSNSIQLPAGTYTWRNPDGCEIGIASALATPPNIVAFTHSLSGTFVLAANSELYLFTKGNVTNAAGTPLGGIQIILPGHLTAWDAGSYVNNDFKQFHSALGTSVLRTMDWNTTNNSYIENWSDRPTLAGVNFRGVYNSCGVPFEAQINLANTLNKPLWINVPVRATDGFVSSLAALVSATYTVNRIYVEYGNEIWNTGGANFFRQTNWVNYLPHTKYTASAAGNVFTRAGHGWGTGKIVRGFHHKQGSENQLISEDGYSGYVDGNMGDVLSVSAIDANTFQLKDAGGDQISCPAGVTTFYIVDPAEAGKSTDLDANYANRSKQIWDIFDAHLGTANVKAVIAGYFENTSHTTARLSTTAIAARADYYAVAPYFWTVHYMGGLGARTTNVITPRFFCNANCTVYAYVYTAGAAPTIANIKAGTGAVGGSTFSHVASGTNYTTGSAVGVVNGTTYNLHFVAIDPNGYTWKWSGAVSASATTDTVAVNDTFDNQKWRSLIRIDEPAGGVMNLADQAAAQLSILTPKGVELVSYECGSHDDSSTTALPDAVLTWKESYFEDAAFGSVLQAYFRQAACAGYKVFTYFRDMAGLGGPWGLADHNLDVTDARYVAMAALSGTATVGSVLAISNVGATAMSASPGAYPATIHSFTATMTYSLVNNNDAENFTISGRAVQLVNDTGLNWSVTATHTLRIHATDGKSYSFFRLSLSTGASGGGGPATWYESDALWAWNSSLDTSAAQMNPDGPGNAVPLTTGTTTDVTIAGGLWKPGAAGFSTTIGMTASAQTATNPFLLVMVANLGTFVTAGSAIMLRIGGFPLVQALCSGNNFEVQYHNGASAESSIVKSLDATTRAYWYYFDPAANRMRYGFNQTYTNPSATAGDTPAHSWPGALTQDLWFDNNSWNIGTTEIVNRSGLGITAALAIVQKVQDVHGL